MKSQVILFVLSLLSVFTSNSYVVLKNKSGYPIDIKINYADSFWSANTQADTFSLEKESILYCKSPNDIRHSGKKQTGQLKLHVNFHPWGALAMHPMMIIQSTAEIDQNTRIITIWGVDSIEQSSEMPF